GLPHDGARPALWLRLLHGLRLLLVAVWLGSAVFFSTAVTQSAFKVLPTRELAGALVSRTLTILNVGGFVLGLLLLAGALAGRRLARWYAWVAEAAALAAVAAATFVGQFVISARMSALRAQMGKPIEEVAADDPLRVAFNALHSNSVTALSVAMLAATVALFLIARRTK
ncbi:MAG TPA: DUF4149 domain-containing protein, partial [Pyrinomonadaceae bacterium]